jgi:GTP pyrophosphokinase
MALSERFDQAFRYASELHREQKRKGSNTPYISHLMGVASLVLEDGGSEDEAIAALLHDAPEDQGGREVLEEIRRRFGEHVAMIVDGCTDSYEKLKPAWQPRKERFLERLPNSAQEVQRVALADKLYNARSLLADLRRTGEKIWVRFNGGKKGTLWYYRSLVEVYRNLPPTPMFAAFEETVTRIEALADRQK